METFKDFIGKTRFRLTQPLPGEKAQLKLEPASRRKFNLDPKSAKVKLSSVLILFFPENETIKIALIQRPEYAGVHSGQIAFPGGKKEDTDKSLMDTALRETYEEIGVLPESIKIIGKLSPLYIPPSNFLVEPFVGYTNETPNFIADPEEVSEILKIDLHELMDDSALQTKEIMYPNFQMKVPCYFINEKIIWGATSMIISELIEVIKH